MGEDLSKVVSLIQMKDTTIVAGIELTTHYKDDVEFKWNSVNQIMLKTVKAELSCE